MTLIGRYICRTGEFFIGDSAISNEHGFGLESISVFYPFVGEINSVFGEKGRYALYWHRQKIVEVRPDLFAAWSGSQQEAENLLRGLRDDLNHQSTLDCESLSDIIDKRVKEIRGKLSYIVRAITADKKIFVVSNVGAEPKSDGKLMAAGTGAQQLRTVFDRLEQAIGTTFTAYPAPDGFGMAMLAMGETMREQIMDSKGCDGGQFGRWGGIFEVAATGEDGLIHRVSPITHLFWTAIQTSEIEWLLICLPYWGYQYTSSHATVHLSYMKPGDTWIVNISQSPLYDDEPEIDFPSAFDTKTTLNFLMLIHRDGSRQIATHYDVCSDDPTVEGVGLTPKGDGVQINVRGMMRLKLSRNLPRGHRFQWRTIVFPEDLTDIDWVGPLWRSSPKSESG